MPSSIARVPSGAVVYDTAYIGKWHIFGSPARDARSPQREYPLGFDYWKDFVPAVNVEAMDRAAAEGA